MTRITPFAARLVAPTVAALALAAGCGGGPNVTAEKDAVSPINLGDGDTPVSRPSSPSTAKGISGALVPPFTLDHTVWYEGFKIKLTTATVDSEEELLTIEGEAENEGPDGGSLYDDVRLEQDSVAIAEGSINTKATVLAGSRNAVTVEIRQLPATFDPEKAVLVIGDSKHQHVRVPLKGRTGAVTGEPAAIAAPKEIIAGGLRLTIDKLSVRGDDPKGHDQADIDKQFVVLEGSVRFDGNPTNFQSQHLSLIPPNGASESAKHLNALPRTGASDDIYVVFDMPTPIGGEYTLQIKGNFIYSDKRFSPDKPVTLDTKITVPAYPPTAAPTKGS